MVSEPDKEGPRKLTGAERAAVVLRELGEHVATDVLRLMDESAINRITAAMSNLRAAPPAVVEKVMSDFSEDLGIHSSDGMRFISSVLSAALGEAHAKSIIEGITAAERDSPFHLPINADPRTLAMQMLHERPQTIALLLAHIPHDTGAAMLSFLPEELASDALYGFTRLDAVSPGAVVELREMLSELMAKSDGGGRRLANLGGARHTADILNHFQAGLSEKVLTAIANKDAETAEKIRANLFTFSDLCKLSDRALQILLREVASDRLTPALRLVDEAVRTKFFQNMSTRTVEVLKEELKSGPPMRRSDALTAQTDIVSIALRLTSEGRISINAAEEMV